MVASCKHYAEVLSKTYHQPTKVERARDMFISISTVLRSMNVLELYSGIGGMHWAMKGAPEQLCMCLFERTVFGLQVVVELSR